MKIKVRRVLALFLAIVFVIGFIPATEVRAEDSVQETQGNDDDGDSSVASWDYRAALQNVIRAVTTYYNVIKNSEPYKKVAEELKEAIDKAKAIIDSGALTPKIVAQVIAELTEKFNEAKQEVEKIKEQIKDKAADAWEKIKEEVEKKIAEIIKEAEEEMDKAKEAWDDSKEEAAKKKLSNEWSGGKWYDANGNQTYQPTGRWKSDAKGWWFEDTSGWYPKAEWQKIDGKWYYFCADGYMDYSEYRDGYWLGADGAWIEVYKGGHWMQDSTGWWYTDEYGWYPRSQSLWIDGVCYDFGADGYWK